jgi:hypothetical protein
MSKERSLLLFRTPPHNYNCAQTIAAGFEQHALVEAFKTCGGGRAPEGICGALNAAMQLAPEAKRAEILEAFRLKNGAVGCHELKQTFRVACPQCVATAAELLEAAHKDTAA